MTTLSEQLEILNQRKTVNDILNFATNCVKTFPNEVNSLKENPLFDETFSPISQEYRDYLDAAVLKLNQTSQDFPIDPTKDL